MAQNIFTGKFRPEDETTLKNILEKDGFDFVSVDHAFWQARRGKVYITFYRSGKVMIQGDAAGEYAQKYLFDLKSNQKQFGLESLRNVESWIGTDESGKGDFFGPLVTAALYVDKKSEHQLWLMGVQDSKKMSPEKIINGAELIKKKFSYEIFTLLPEQYNFLYDQYKNLNKVLAFTHVQAIRKLVEKTKCRIVLSDKFGNETLMQNEVGETLDIRLIQEHRAEANLAVAGASILARANFVENLAAMSKKYRLAFPPGASAQVVEAAKKFIQQYGRDELKNVAKLHFKTVKLLA